MNNKQGCVLTGEDGNPTTYDSFFAIGFTEDACRAMVSCNGNELFNALDIVLKKIVQRANNDVESEAARIHLRHMTEQVIAPHLDALAPGGFVGIFGMLGMLGGISQDEDTGKSAEDPRASGK